VRGTHIAKDDRRDDSGVVPHANVALECVILGTQGLRIGQQFRLAQDRDRVVADRRLCNPDFWRNGGGDKGVHRGVAELVEHRLGLCIIRADMALLEGVKGREDGAGLLQTGESTNCRPGAGDLQAGETLDSAQAQHWEWGRNEGWWESPWTSVPQKKESLSTE